MTTLQSTLELMTQDALGITILSIGAFGVVGFLCISVILLKRLFVGKG